MPQLDSVTFFNQLFWFTLVFFGFYFFVIGTIVPKIAFVLKTRAKKLQLDLSSSALLKLEAFTVASSYDNEFILLSSTLINGVDSSLSVRTVWLSSDNSFVSPHKSVLSFYMGSLVKLFLKNRILLNS